MASMSGSIQVSCQQTRFHIADNNLSREINVQDLNIGLLSREDNDASSSKPKNLKARTAVLEILNGAHLRIKSGGRYGLIGRNGSGKSTLLTSLAEKLIPALPSNVRITAMRQMDSQSFTGRWDSKTLDGESTVREYVARSDRWRNRVEGELAALTEALQGSESLNLTKCLREIELDRAREELFAADKIARLRSGARGFDARKFLRAHEKTTEEARLKLEALDIHDETGTAEDETQKALSLQTRLQGELDHVPSVDLEAKAVSILAGLGFSEDLMDAKVRTLSGGWRMRCQLAAALLPSADVLILDEPTNFLDMFGMLWLQDYLEKLQDTSESTAVVLVSHDRDFVNTTCDELIILRDKQLSYFQGNIDSYEKSMKREVLRMTRMKEAQERQAAHMTKTVANTMQQGKKTGDDSKLRQAKSRQKKLDERIGLQVSANGGRFKLNRDLMGWHENRRDEILVPKEEGIVSLRFPPAPDMRFRSSLMSLENVSFRYPKASKPTLREIDLTVHPGDRIGLVGLNGAGKTTLVQLLTGTLKPTTGILQTYPRLKTGFYSQHTVDDLAVQGRTEPALTALSLLANTASDRDISASTDEQDLRKLLAGVGLVGRTVSDTPLAKLSGGQLVRLALALLFLDPPHVLILDEPSTHLDLATVAGLARMLQTWNGAVLLISHDRFMVKTIVENDPVDPEASDDEATDEQGEERECDRRRLVYKLQGGKLTEVVGGIVAWEHAVEKKLYKAGVLSPQAN